MAVAGQLLHCFVAGIEDQAERTAEVDILKTFFFFLYLEKGVASYIFAATGIVVLRTINKLGYANTSYYKYR